MNYINFKVKHLKWLVFLGVLSVFFIGTDQVQHQAAAAELTNEAASWTSIGPYGGCINSLAMSKTNPDVIYAGTDRGVYKTIDATVTWTKTGLSEKHIYVVQVDPSNPDIVYAGTLDFIYKSEDGGGTWTQKELSDDPAITTIAIDPNNPDILYTGTSYWSEEDQKVKIDIFKSTDGGETWDIIKSWEEWGVCGWSDVNFMLVDPDNSSYIYAGGDNSAYCPEFGGFLKSTDGGGTWVNKNLTSSSWDAVVALAKPSNSQMIYAIAKPDQSSYYLYKSSDRGDNWFKVECPYTTMEGRVLAVNPVDPKWVYVGTNDVVYSHIWAYNNDEDAWYYLSSEGLLPASPSSFVAHPQESRVFYAGFSAGGVYKYIKDTSTWNPTNQGMNSVAINTLAVHPTSSETVYVAGEGFGYPLAKTANVGTSWDYLVNSPSGINTISFDPQNPLNIFVGKAFQGSLGGVPVSHDFFIHRSTDDGLSWTAIKFAECTGDSCATKISEILIKENNSDYILIGTTPRRGMGYIGIGMLARTTDGGATWDDLSIHTTALAVDPNNPDILYCGSEQNGRVYQVTDVWGNGNVYEITPAGGILDVQDIEVDMNSRVYVAAGGDFMKWDGSDWTDLIALSEYSVKSLAIDRNTTPETIYAGTYENGIFVSQDGGSTWIAFNDGLENLDITKLAISKTQPKMLYAGTAYGGVWSIAIGMTYTISGNVSIGEASSKMKITGGGSGLPRDSQPDELRAASSSRKMSTQAGLGGVVMSGFPGNPTTDVSGNYNATVEEGWSGTVTPTKAGFTFSPSSRTYTNVTSDETQDYTAIAITPTISGMVKTSDGTGIAGVTLDFSNGGGAATTDSNGNYSNELSYGWSGTATPTKAGYAFTPSSRTYSNVISDKTDEDYTATILTYTISGNVGTAEYSIKIQAAAGLSGVVMDGLPGDPTTDASGNYSATADYGFSGTVTPTKAGYSFSPPSRDYTNVTSDQQNQDYTASIIQHALTITAGNGGTTDPSPGNYVYNHGAEVSVTAAAETGYRFSGWTGDVPSGHENDNPVTITMDEDKSITANFIAQYTLTIAAGAGGTTDPAPGSYTYDNGTEVSVTATEDTGYSFSGWTGDVPSGHENDNPVAITMDSDKTITANFIAQHTLIIVAGTGGTTDPEPGSYPYDSGTQASVTAIPSSGYQFSGWGGDASGTATTITINMDSDKSITANFTATPPEQTETGGGGKAGKKGGCFIATAAYGSPLHPHLDILRDFRDTYLIPSKLGRAMVDVYYKYSPFVAGLIAKYKVLRIVVRINLLPLVALSYLILHSSPAITTVFLVFIFLLPGFFVYFYRRRIN